MKKAKNLKRIYHTWDKWECYPAGLYETGWKEKEDEECKKAYYYFLSDPDKFRGGLEMVLAGWKNSCEHYLTNESMNRIAWLGQASACAVLGIPHKYASGYFLLSEQQRKDADNLALEYLNKWLLAHGFDSVDLQGAGVSSQVNLY